MASAMDAAVDNSSKALDTSGIGKNTVEGLEMGMSLAKRAQDIDQKRQEMQFKQQQVDMQKHDWMHDQLKGALSEDDPKLRGVLLDNMSEQFPKLFDGKRMDPATMELMKKAPAFGEKMLAAVRVREAMRTGNFDKLSEFDEHVMNGMTSSDIASKLKELNTIKTNEAMIIKGVTAKGVATPQAAQAAGMDQGEMQEIMNRNNPGNARMAMADLRKDDQASKAGTAFDTATKPVFKQIQALDRGVHTLKSDSKLTPQMFREIEQEFSNALSGSGAAGLGKLERTEYNSIGLKAAEIKQKYGDKPVDLKKEEPAFVNQLADSMYRLNQAYGENMEKIATNVHENYGQTSNPKVQEMRKRKLQEYAPNAYAKMYGGDGVDGSEQQSMPSNPGNPENKGPKMTSERKAELKQLAIEKLKQIKSSPPGLIPVSEQDVRDKYKFMTGEDFTP